MTCMALNALSRTAARHLWHGGATRAPTELLAARSSQFSTNSSQQEVCFVDPRTMLTGPQQIVEEDICTLSIPESLVTTLDQGHMELGDADDPLNAWLWGKRGELFEMQLVGGMPTRSGFAGILPKQELDRFITGGRRPPLTWQAFLSHMEGAGPGKPPPYPFLFAGRILESSHASVYVLKDGGQVTGVMLSSMAAEQDED